MKCELYCDDRNKRDYVKCGEQATMLWLASRDMQPIPCCAYHAQDCPGEILSLAQSEDSAHSVTFLPYEAHA
jgi:hypothetical protein